MKSTLFFVLLLLALPLSANELPYDFQAYDFCESYQFTGQGLLITVHNGDDLLVHNRKTHGEITLKEGDFFRRFVPGRAWVDTYTLTQMTSQRAYFIKQRNSFTFDPNGPYQKKVLLGRQLDQTNFFLPKDHYFGWIGWLFPTIEIHPGDQVWRTR